MCPGASRKTKGAEHFAQNDGAPPPGAAALRVKVSGNLVVPQLARAKALLPALLFAGLKARASTRFAGGTASLGCGWPIAST
jgi:hypothetical protein